MAGEARALRSAGAVANWRRADMGYRPLGGHRVSGRVRYHAVVPEPAVLFESRSVPRGPTDVLFRHHVPVFRLADPSQGRRPARPRLPGHGRRPPSRASEDHGRWPVASALVADAVSERSRRVGRVYRLASAGAGLRVGPHSLRALAPRRMGTGGSRGPRHRIADDRDRSHRGGARSDQAAAQRLAGARWRVRWIGAGHETGGAAQWRRMVLDEPTRAVRSE